MEGFIGQIMIFAGNFAPRSWAFCDGQLLPISQNTALFSILGTTYGGDGRTTFALPDMRSRAGTHAGTGPGLSTKRLGQKGGEENVAINATTMPTHNHGFQALASIGEGEEDAPNNHLVGSEVEIYASPSNLVNMAPLAVANTGGSQAHNNMQPYTVLSYVICLQGIFPSRS